MAGGTLTLSQIGQDLAAQLSQTQRHQLADFLIALTQQLQQRVDGALSVAFQQE